MRFLDLSSVLQDEAGTGTELYYPFDTHWNQLGQDLVARSINNYIEKRLSNLSSETLGH
jgi:SGNH hydrolase-like domain, acetyltransferase AlgX